jgi:RNA polymerase sigma factor (sigma-70 family)
MNDKVNTNENSDKELLKLVKKEKSFFGEVYKRYYKKIFNYIRRRVKSKSICEDLTSEVFEKAYNAIDDFKWQGISISAWLFRIAKNLLTDYYRKSGRIGEIISLS